MMTQTSTPGASSSTSLHQQSSSSSSNMQDQHLALHAQQEQQQQQAYQPGYYSCVYKNTMKKRRTNTAAKRVTFATEATAHRHPLSWEEVNDTWYSRQQLAELKQDRKQTVRALKNANFDATKLDLSFYCLRGYEAYSSVEFNKLLQKQRMLVVRNVLVEQEKQRNLLICMLMEESGESAEAITQTLPFSILDAERLRRVTIQRTEWAKGRAIQLAMQDGFELGYPPIASIVLDYEVEEDEDEEEDVDQSEEQEDDVWDDAQQQEADNASETYSQYHSVQGARNDVHHEQQVATTNGRSSTSQNLEGVIISGNKNYDSNNPYGNDEEPSLMGSTCSASTHSSTSSSTHGSYSSRNMSSSSKYRSQGSVSPRAHAGTPMFQRNRSTRGLGLDEEAKPRTLPPVAEIDTSNDLESRLRYIDSQSNH